MYIMQILSLVCVQSVTVDLEILSYGNTGRNGNSGGGNGNGNGSRSTLVMMTVGYKIYQ